MTGTHVRTEPLAATADALRRGRTTPAAYVDRLRSRAAAVEPEVRALVPEDGRWDRLDAAARALADRHPDPADRPPLYGVPVGVKDIFHADGFRTRAGSDLPPEVLAGPEADAVSALRAAGALVLGKTVTTEFAYAAPGPTRNPHDVGHTPGGSSSGSAAAVAAGLCPLALGTQTVGSVIRPAAFCGVIGVKPSYGRISRDGVIPFAPSVDHVGFFAAEVAGARLAAATLSDDWRPLPAPGERPTLGVPEGPYLDQATDAGLAAFRDALDRLDAAGYDVRRVDTLDDVDAINDRHDRLKAGEAAIAHEAWYGEYGDRYAGRTRELIETGREVPARALAAGRRSRVALRARLTDRTADADVDAWIAPAAPGPAPAGIDSTGDPVMNLPWTHAGLPTVALPAGRVDGLPVGVQVAGRYGDDETVLAWAEDLAGVVETGE